MDNPIEKIPGGLQEKLPYSKPIKKSTWLDIDKTCEKCGQVTQKAKGLTKQNLKKLFTFSFSFTEILITFMIIMILVMAWAYKVETQQCRDWIKPMHSGTIEECKNVCDDKCELIRTEERLNADLNKSDELNLDEVNVTAILNGQLVLNESGTKS